MLRNFEASEVWGPTTAVGAEAGELLVPRTTTPTAFRLRARRLAETPGERWWSASGRRGKIVDAVMCLRP